MSGHAISARDVPEARRDIIEWARATQGKGADAMRPGFAHMVAVNAAHAELYFVNRDMTAMARTVGAGLDKYGLSREDLPSDHGFLVWEGPVTDEPAHGAPIAVLWFTHNARLMITLMVAGDAYSSWAKTFSPQAGRDARLITAGRLTLRGQGPQMPLDKPDRPWETLGLGNFEDTARTLLATWILIRQPVDARKSLHDVEEVLPSKASARRIERLGGDPTRAVRLVTLRQSLRRSGRDSSADHAEHVYRHRWIVRPHRVNQYYPSRNEHQTIWRGPYLVVPPGCEEAPILGGDRVNVLRR